MLKQNKYSVLFCSVVHNFLGKLYMPWVIPSMADFHILNSRLRCCKR